MIGRVLSHYEVLARIGAGGMGEVYLAKDRRIGREVALKVLPESFAKDTERLRRLQREARILGSLDHPHIVTLYSAEEAEGVHFLTMAYIDGERLDTLIPTPGLPLERLLELAAEIAAALRAAHQQGVVHRDLKPSNVMVDRNGRVRVLDFGLAKATEQPAPPEAETEADSELTRDGTRLGTLPYMSPEQLEGGVLDTRSDLFSLGVMLHEMAAGSRPFRGQSPAALASAILKDAPDDLAARRPELPARFVRLVARCLEKAPQQRVQTARELLDEIEELKREIGARRRATLAVPVRPGWRWWIGLGLSAVLASAVIVALGPDTLKWRAAQGRDAAPIIHSLAVLPLRDLSGGEPQEYFADGMTEALTTDLSKIGALKVISSTSMTQYKKTDKPPRQIARELGVEGVVSGSVVREASRVRVTAQLVDTATGRNLWAESYDRDLKSILSLEGEIARAIAAQIAVRLTPGETSGFADRRQIDPRAYDAYLNGRFHSLRLTPASLDTAQRYFESALEIEPDWAPAYVGLANVWGGRRQMGFASRETAMARGLPVLLKALELDDTLPALHSSLASFHAFGEWNWQAAESEYRRALELDPNHASTLKEFSHYLQIMGRPDEAMKQIEKAVALDPLNANVRGFYGVNLVFVRRYDEAIRQFERALATEPDMPFVLHALAATHWLKGNLADCVAMKRRELALGNPEVERALVSGYQEGGFAAGMRRAAERIAHSPRAARRPQSVARLYVMAGETEAALDWLERGYDAHDSGMPYLGLPFWDTLREDPRFQRLVQQLGLPNPTAAKEGSPSARPGLPGAR